MNDECNTIGLQKKSSPPAKTGFVGGGGDEGVEDSDWEGEYSRDSPLCMKPPGSPSKKGFST